VRVDPAGGGTDAPPFSIDQGGTVVNFGVNLHAYASVDLRPKGEGVTIWSLDRGVGVTAPSVEALADEEPLRFLRAFVRRLVPPGDSVLLVTDSDVPMGSGLGGSGALGVAIVAAIDRAYGRERSRAETAELGNQVERGDLGFAGGSQDSYSAAFGGLNRLEYHRGGGTTRHEVSASEATRLALESASLLVFTGKAQRAQHVSGKIHEGIRGEQSKDDDSPTLRALLTLREAAKAMAAALERCDLAGYVAALSESNRSLYALHPSCRSADHERCIDELGDAILGAKTCGAGGGGFLLLHTRPDRRRECWRRAEELGAQVWPMTIDREGVVTWEEAPASEEEVRRCREMARGAHH
jgi:D-glycero-alpha-D-manno-heptose-7-phosphate kinase